MTSLPPARRPAVAKRLALAALLAAAFAVALPPSVRANVSAASGKGDPVRSITSQLICPCSCGEVLAGCTCETGISLKGYVDKEVKGGKDRQAIEAALIAKYGEVILGAPKAKGFNLVVWVAPFVATLIGFGIASMILVRWVRRKQAVVETAGAAPGADPSTDSMMEQLRARAEAELRELKR